MGAEATVIREESEERSFYIKQRETASGRVAVLGHLDGVETHQRKPYPHYFRNKKT
jgi:hypothetical protein